MMSMQAAASMCPYLLGSIGLSGGVYVTTITLQ